MQFKALVTSEENRTFVNSIVTKDISDLPNNDTLIKVKYSSLNFKDALSASGNKGVTRNYPHTPGIDAAGIIEETSGFSRTGRIALQPDPLPKQCSEKMCTAGRDGMQAFEPFGRRTGSGKDE